MKWQSPAMPFNPSKTTAPLIARITEELPEALAVRADGEQTAVFVPRERLLEVCRMLKDTLSFDLLVVETAVDWVDWFDVVYVVRSTGGGGELAFTLQVDHDDGVVPSISSVWSAAVWMERETYDLLGITFEGHPDLRRILTWDEFAGHPLRKDFGLGADDAAAYDQVPPGYKKVGEE